MRFRFVIFVALACGAGIVSAQDYPRPSDVESIDAIVNAYYDVISGPAGYVYDGERDASLHAPDAIITRLTAEGLGNRHDLAAEQATVPAIYDQAFFEVEINRVVEHYGNMAHVWSTYEIRGTPDGDATASGLNSLSLYQAEGRWWIASWSTQLVEDGNLPERYSGK